MFTVCLFASCLFVSYCFVCLFGSLFVLDRRNPEKLRKTSGSLGRVLADTVYRFTKEGSQLVLALLPGDPTIIVMANILFKKVLLMDNSQFTLTVKYSFV